MRIFTAFCLSLAVVLGADTLADAYARVEANGGKAVLIKPEER